MSESASIGGCLLRHLHEKGPGHPFGAPGDHVLRLDDRSPPSTLVHIGATSGDRAAFAAAPSPAEIPRTDRRLAAHLGQRVDG